LFIQALFALRGNLGNRGRTSFLKGDVALFNCVHRIIQEGFYIRDLSMLQIVPFFSRPDGWLELLDILAMAICVVCRAIDKLSKCGDRLTKVGLWSTHWMQLFAHQFAAMCDPIFERDNFAVPLCELVAHQLHQMVEFGIISVPVSVDFR
jgi:hypothetical protein